MTADRIDERILEHLQSRGPSKAKQIADALGLERTAVNQALYGPLRGKVRQTKEYKWSLASSRTTTEAQPDRANANARANLFRYYLDCLSQDEDSGVSVFADSKYDIDYAELDEWPFDATQAIFADEPARKLISKQRRESRKKALWLGYPVLLKRARGRNGWEGTFLEPLFLWPQDTDSSDLLFLPEPTINCRALASLTQSENVLEEAARLAEELGLDASETPPLDELIARTREIRPEWSWSEPLIPAAFRKFGELRTIQQTGIYNAAVIVLADRSPYTVGLERELSELRTVPDDNIGRSALGSLLGASGTSVQYDGPLLEPAPLNAEQRTAVRQALSEPLTVITGPPGTGKSQVVTAILVNAAWRGLRVLFASKNNKAVDVVMERVNGLTARPIMLRLGTRALQEQLAQHITAVLSGKPTDDDRRASDQSLAKLKDQADTLRKSAADTAALVRLRNKVDELERACEEARQSLPEETFRRAADIDLSDAEVAVRSLREAIRRAEQQNAPWLERIFWGFLKETRQRELAGAGSHIYRLLEVFGFVAEKTASPTALAAEAVAFIEHIDAAARYKAKLNELENAPDTGELAKRIAAQTRDLADTSKEAWTCWATLLPDRLSAPDRAALGDYAAVLRTISKADEEGGTVASQIWRRYYELASKTTKALPCWAVTSLSARGRVPFTAADFDILIIDEASQCDIASVLPLLYRCKRAVIIGDPQQLRHISRLSQRRDQALMVKHDVLDKPGPSWGYRANSLYDLAAARVSSDSIVVLRDHHRSHEDIINFSNTFFYGGKLRVATDYRRLKRPDGPALRWVSVRGHAVRPASGGAVNQEEAAAVVAELKRIAIVQRFPGEIGVVTPFRAQANYINELISQDDTLAATLASRNFIVDTAHGFQGDERDLIIFSPVVSQNTPSTATGFLASQGNIFNVGITRARGALVVVGDAAACSTCNIEYLSAFAKYVFERSEQGPLGESANVTIAMDGTYPTVSRPELVSDWEKVLYSALTKSGIRTVPQYPIDQYILDLALVRPNGRRLDIEIDGERYHRDWDGELVRRDQLRNLRLIEMGWDVMRFWVYEVRDDLSKCVSRVAEWARRADDEAATS